MYDCAYRAIPMFRDINDLDKKSWRMPMYNGVKVNNTANSMLEELSVTAFGRFPYFIRKPKVKIMSGKVMCMRP